MYELTKKIGKVFTSEFVGSGPSSYEKEFTGPRLTKVEKHLSTHTGRQLDNGKLVSSRLDIQSRDIIPDRWKGRRSHLFSSVNDSTF